MVMSLMLTAISFTYVQAKSFLEHFHESRKSKVRYGNGGCYTYFASNVLFLSLSGSLLLDGERWKQADVPSEIQTLVHRLEAGMTPNVVTRLVHVQVWC